MSNDDKKLIQSLNNIPYLSDRLREANNRIKSYSKVFFLKSKLMMDVLENLSVNYDKKLKGEQRNYDDLQAIIIPWIEVMTKSKEFKTHDRRYDIFFSKIIF